MKVLTDRSNAVCKGIRDIHNGADNLKNVTGLRGFARDAENTVRPLNDIVKGLKDMYGVLRDFNEPWAQSSITICKISRIGKEGYGCPS